MIPIGKELELRAKAIEITQSLRKKGITADYDLMGRKLKKALDYAGRLDVPIVVLVGKKDLAEGRVTVRDMVTGEQIAVKIERVPEELSRLLRR